MPHEIGCCTKYFLFSFNILFWIIGLCLLGAGIWAWSEKGFFDNISVISSLPIDPVLVLIIIALVMFLLSFSGCLGSLRENIFLLKCFSICLGVIFFAELIAGILGFVYKDWFHQQFAIFVNKTIKGYRDDPDLQNIIDFSQEYLKCCGGDTGVSDWDNNVYFSCTSRIKFNDVFLKPAESCGVPFSCCIKENAADVVNTQCGYGLREDSITVAEQVTRIHTSGCITQFGDWLKTNLYTVAGAFIGVALIQIIPICFAQNLISDIQAVKAGWLEEKWSRLESMLKEESRLSNAERFTRTAYHPRSKTARSNSTVSPWYPVQCQEPQLTPVYCNVPHYNRMYVSVPDITMHRRQDSIHGAPVRRSWTSPSCVNVLMHCDDDGTLLEDYE